MQARHADDWLMTYADTITLLLCLFLVMISASSAKKNHVPAASVVPAMRMAPKPIDPFGGRLPFPIVADAIGSGRDDADDFPDEAVVARPVPIATRARMGMAPAVRAGLAAASPKPAIAALPSTLARLMSQGKAGVEQHGDRLTTVQMSSAAFFDVGSATISESGKNILRDVAASLTSPRFDTDLITVEGHTDDAPIHSAQFPSNWELSTARASAVVHFLLGQGIDPRRLRAAGYADTFPVAPNRDAEGRAIPENQARNRRVVIRLEALEEPRN